jgi:AhpD family alkylhydroperoxidase
MQPRIDYAKMTSSAAYKAMYGLEKTVRASGLEHTLLALVKMRASQINGCAFCLDMHVKEATIHGERPLRLHHLAIWRESPLFTPRERAALAWTESLTRLGEYGVPDDVYEQARMHFSEKELAVLTFAVAEINGWNRLNIAARNQPGTLDQMLGLTAAGLS